MTLLDLFISYLSDCNSIINHTIDNIPQLFSEISIDTTDIIVLSISTLYFLKMKFMHQQLTSASLLCPWFNREIKSI